MTVSEFTFLALGLVLGVFSGAALIEIIRARPPARRDVRVTVSRNAIPRRATTLADDAFVAVGPEPARGGPADRRAMEGPAPLGTADRRTNVLSEAPERDNAPGETRPATGWLVGVPVAAGRDPMIGALHAGGGAAERSRAAAAASPRSQTATAEGTAQAAVALLDSPSSGSPGATPVQSGPCAEERRLANERCELATRARTQAVAAADALRQAQRAYDSHTSAARAAADAADPGTLRSLKEFAQRDFRAASRAANTPDAVEAAARTWLHAINRINLESAGALRAADREREAAAAISATLVRLALEADAAQSRAERADAACLAARSAVADCDEQATPARSAAVPPAIAPGAGADIPSPAGKETLGRALEDGGAPRIFRLLRSDQDAMERLVASLAGDDPDEQGRWRLALAGLVDAIVADTIMESFLRFPDDHVFWGLYTVEQNRDIARALASLGYRFDGLGGWVDERLPSQRELSLALSFAGLDPMRVRQWPSEGQTAELFRNVEVAADEYLAGVAGDLTLAEMVDMLGRRADGLVELWNQWGRIRPLLLEDA